MSFLFVSDVEMPYIARVEFEGVRLIGISKGTQTDNRKDLD